MKSEMKTKGLKMLNHVAMAAAKQSANSSCVFIQHQPKLPNELKAISKRS